MRARLAPQCFAANVCCLSIAYPRLSERQPVGCHLQACTMRVKRSETLPYRSATAHAHSIAPVSPAPIAYAERDGFPTFYRPNRQIENFSFTPPFLPIFPPFNPVFENSPISNKPFILNYLSQKYPFANSSTAASSLQKGALRPSVKPPFLTT